MVTVNKPNQMYLRFYDQSKSNVNNIMKSILRLEKHIIKYTIKSLTHSMNIMTPDTKNYEVLITAKNRKDLLSIYNNKLLFKFYEKNVIGKKLKKQLQKHGPVHAHKRKIGDIAFNS